MPRSSAGPASGDGGQGPQPTQSSRPVIPGQPGCDQDVDSKLVEKQTPESIRFHHWDINARTTQGVC